jgi:hypothetical protein
MSPQKQNLWLFHGADSNPEQSITILTVYHRATIAIFYVNTSKVFNLLFYINHSVVQTHPGVKSHFQHSYCHLQFFVQGTDLQRIINFVTL